MEKNILIAEANDRQRLKITKAVSAVAAKAGVSVKIYKAVNAVRAMRILEKNNIDMLILNTGYRKNGPEDLSGIRLVEELRKREKYMLLPVIFISNRREMREYIFDGLNSLGCLPYEFENEALDKLIEKSLHYTTARDEKVELYLKDKSTLYPVLVKDIVYIKTHMKGLRFQLQNGRVITVMNRTLVDVKRKLKNQCLLQCGRNIIVNRNYINSFHKDTLTLVSGGETICMHISDGYQSILRKELL